MTPRAWSRLDSALARLPVVVAVCFGLLYVGLAVLRLGHPFELEWMEGGAVGQVSWILSGHKLYGPPSLDFTPWVYPPLYFYVAAFASRLVGVGFLPLRLVSLVASIGSFALIYALVSRETGNRRAAILSAGLFAATYQLGGTWFDLARIDSLFLVLLLAALYVARFGESLAAAVLAGALMSLSFFSKQTALVVAAPLAVGLAVSDWRRGAAFAATLVALVTGGTLLLDLWQDGWFSYYVFTVPGRLSARVLTERVFYFWTRDLILPLSVAAGFSAFALLAADDGWRRKCLCYAAAMAGMFAGSWIPRMQSGGYVNTLIPAYAAVCVLFGLGWHRVAGIAAEVDPPHRSQLRVVVNLLCVMQFAALVYNPLSALPRPGDVEAGRRIVDRLRAVEGDVLVFTHPYLASMAGKPMTAHAVAVIDVLGWGDEQDKVALRRQITDAIASRRFAAIVLDDRNDEVFSGALGGYEERGMLVDDPRAFFPVTGFRVRPTRLYVPGQAPR